MSTNNIAARGTKAFAWGLGGALGKVGAQLLVQITLARMLDPVAFGQYAAVLTVIGFGYLFSEGGFGAALIQKKDITEADIGLALGWSLLAAIFISTVIVALSSILATQFGDPSLAQIFSVCTLFLPLLISSNLATNLLRRDLHMRGIQIIHLIAYTVFFGGVAAICASIGFGVWSLVAGFGAQTLFSAIATYLISRHTLRPRLRGDRAIINFGTKSLAADLTGWLIDNVDKLLIGKFWGVHALGLYSVAFNLSRAPTSMLVSTANTVAFASTARLQDNVLAMRKGFLISLTATALATAPLLSLVAFESATVLNIVYGVKWLSAAPYLTALACAIPWISTGMITAGILRGTGDAGTQVRIQLIAAFLLIGGLTLFREASPFMAVWVVPLVFFVRFVLLADALRTRIAVPAGEIFAAFRGAVVLAAAGVGVAAAVHGAPPAASIAMGVLPLLAGVATIALLIVVRCAWFLGTPLVTMILARRSDGPLVAFVARVLGVTQ